MGTMVPSRITTSSELKVLKILLKMTGDEIIDELYQMIGKPNVSMEKNTGEVFRGKRSNPPFTIVSVRLAL